VVFCALGLAGAASSLLAGGTAWAVNETTTTTTETTSTPGAAGAPGSTSLTSTAPTTTYATTTYGATTHATTTSQTTTTTTPLTTTTTLAVPPETTTSTAPTTVVLSGHGWGHGMGMSQWGAYGYALHGWTYAAILAHYYTGTTLGSDPPVSVRVLLEDGLKRVTLGSAAGWRVVDAAGTIVALPAGTIALDSSLTVGGQQLVSPLTFTPGRQPLQVGATAYHGTITAVLARGEFQIVNRVGIEAYVQGVVPAEVPSTWPTPALEAQAVAARSYALAVLTTIVTAGNYDLFGDTRSQAYGGISAETPATNAAVKATAHQVVMYGGKIAMTYFSSSSGGRTVSAQEATGKAVPYLVSVDDPYDTYAPSHDWGPVVFGAAQVAKAIGLNGTLLDLRTANGPSSHVATATAIGSTGSVTLTGDALRSDLGLRSTWFSVGWLALTPLPAPTSYGAGATLTGIARGVSGVTLESKVAGGDWQLVSTITPDASGAFTSVVAPAVTTQYRLSSGILHAALVKVAVVPRVAASIGSGSVAGTMRPALAGAPVQLQLQAVTGWKTVATGTADAVGSFALTATLVPGSYRVRCSPGHGLSPGVSPSLVVA
jgi:stage II sporulation protein D